MNAVRFTVIGEAEPQGSAKGFAVPVKDRAGRRLIDPRTGLPKMRVVITSDNPKLKAWRTTVARAVQAALGGVVMEFSGGFSVEATFLVKPPQHIPADRGGLPIVRDDLDKLVRGLLDAITGILWRDDGQVVDLVARKRYAPAGTLPRVDVTITPIAVGLPLFSDTETRGIHVGHADLRPRRSATAAAGLW